MDNLEGITRSCKRLPVLVKTKAPACMLVTELRMLTDRVLEAIEHALSDDLHDHMACRRLLRVVDNHAAGEPEEQEGQSDQG